jgi:hypothetical protein
MTKSGKKKFKLILNTKRILELNQYGLIIQDLI